MALLSLASRMPKVDGLSILTGRHFFISLNALQIHSYLLTSGETKKYPFQKQSLKSRQISSSTSRLFNSIPKGGNIIPKEETLQSLPESHPYLAEIKPALGAIRKACRITTYLQPTTVDKNISGVNKKDASPVTIGDFAVQALVLNLLEKKFGQNIFIAEEASKNLISENEHGETLDLSHEILDVMLKCGFDGTIGSVDVLKRSIDIGQTYEQNGKIKESVLESKNIHDTSFRSWCLDPIDGTRGFLRGKREGGQYCVALALIEVSESTCV